MPGVFVSHVAEDAPVALAIALALERSGVSTWCYEVDSLFGTYLLQTREAIEHADTCLVLLSPRSLGATQVNIEIVRALETRKVFVPVLLDTTYEALERAMPSWAQAFGDATARSIGREGVDGVVRDVLAALPRLGISPGAPDPAHTMRLAEAHALACRSEPQIERPLDAIAEQQSEIDLPAPRSLVARAHERIAHAFRLLDRRSMVMLLLVPLWFATCAATVFQMRHGGLVWVGVIAGTPKTTFLPPTVRGVWPDPIAETAGLEPGRDVLLDLDGAPLGGMGPVGFMALALEHRFAAGGSSSPIVRVQRDGLPERSVIVPFVPVAYAWRIPLVGGAFALGGLLLLLRRADARLPRATYLGMLSFALHWTWFFGGPRWLTYAWTLLFVVASTFFMPLMLRATLLVPDEMPPPPRAPRWPWAFAMFGPIVTSYVWGVPFPPAIGVSAMFAMNALFFAVFLSLLTYRYGLASPRGQRQLRWFLYSLYISLIPVGLASVIVWLLPGHEWIRLFDAAMVLEVFFPVCLLIAVARSNLFDVDRLIATTTIFYALLIAVAVPTLVLAPRLADAAGLGRMLPSSLQGATDGVVLLACLGLARLSLPWFDRIFRTERVRFRDAVETIRRRIDEHRDAESLLIMLGERLREVMRLERCTVYVRTRAGFAARLAHAPRGASPTPALLGPRDRIVAVTARHTGPIDLQGAWATLRGYRVDPREQDVLAPLDAEVIVPIHRTGLLEGFLALGTKHSLDVFTTTEVQELARLGERASAQLLRGSLEAIASSTVAGEISAAPTLLRPTHAQVSVIVVENVAPNVSNALAAAGAIVDPANGNTTGFWNAPVPCADHATRACRTALEALADTRVGIATGPCVVENRQKGNDLRIVARGDAVEWARALERLNTQYGTRVLMIDETRDRLSDEFICRDIDLVHLGQRAGPTTIHELLGLRSRDHDGRLRGLENAFARALSAYRARAFDEALTAFERLRAESPDDRVTLLYIERCRVCLAAPPDPSWDHVVKWDV